MSFGRLSGSRNLCEGDLPNAGCLVIWWLLISGFLGFQAALYQLAQLVAIVALHVHDFDAIAIGTGVSHHGGEVDLSLIHI